MSFKTYVNRVYSKDNSKDNFNWIQNLYIYTIYSSKNESCRYPLSFESYCLQR